MRMGRAVWVSAATMSSRILGLARDQLFAALIGANRFSDAFVVAFRIPNLLRDLFAEGALSSAFVPAFADYQRNRGPTDAYRLANALVTVVLVMVGGLTLAGMCLAHPLVSAMNANAGSMDSSQLDLTAQLTRIMMPFLLLVSFSALAMGMLNAQARFSVPALAPALFNVGSIAVGLGLWAFHFTPGRAVVGWAWGTLLGGLLQLLVQIPSLWKLGFRPRLLWGRATLAEPGLRRIGKVMAAAVVGQSATQINVVVNTLFALREVAANTWLSFAFRLMQLPLGVFGVAVATLAGAGVARHAAAGEMLEVRRTLGSALRLVAFLNIPSAVGLAVLAHPIVSLIYQHRRFGPADTNGTAQALVWYALGLYGYSAIKVMAPAFYALNETRVPVMGSIAGVACNIGLNLLLYPVLGYRGTALGTSIGATVNFIILLSAWRRRHGDLGGSGVTKQLLKVGIAATALAGAAWGSLKWFQQLQLSSNFLQQLAAALGPIAVAAATYCLVAKLLKIEELTEILGVLRRKSKQAANS